MAQDPLEEFRRLTAELTGPGGAFELRRAPIAQHNALAGTPPHFLSVLNTARQRHGDKVFFTYEGEDRTYEELLAAADDLARGLRKEHGIAAGDRVGLAMRNRFEWFEAFFALLRLGAVATLLNSRGAADEICGTASQVGCKLIIADDARAHMLGEVSDCTVLDLGLMQTVKARGRTSDRPLDHVPDGDDPIIIIFTSGTTGRPKGATLTHGNLCAVYREMELRAETGLRLAAKNFGQDVEAMRAAMPPPQPVLFISPMFHISGIVSMIGSIMSGGRNILLRRWQPEKALGIIEGNEVGSLSGPSLVFADLLDLPDAANRMRSLRSCAVAGQATPARLGSALRDQLPEMAVTSCWGQTELTGAATTGNGATFAAHPASVGQALATHDIRIVDAAGDDLPTGEVGEILVRGPNVMAGYWGDEEANARAFRDGWLCSGDMGWIDERGLLYIADRMKDMVISKGENIYCAEVERVLSMMEEQGEVALFGVADERLGERAIAAVVRRGDARLDEADVKRHVAAHLADYKVPAEVRFDLGPLPRNELGKVDKPALVARYHKHCATPA